VSSVGPGEFEDLLIRYGLSGLMGQSFVSNTLSMSGSSVEPDGVVTAIEDKCGGAMFGGSDPSTPCSGTLIGPLIVFDIGTLADLTETSPDFAITSLQVIPDYHYALANLARLRSAQNRHDEAARLLKQRYDSAPHPENLYDLAEALERAGRAADARTAYAEFEKRALKEAEGWDNANRQLIFYYAKHAGKPDEALRIARMEIARRQDVYTLDAYAWALYANSDHRQARDQISRVLAVGTKDPEVVARARIISAQSRD
jgi:hypothetical protein